MNEYIILGFDVSTTCVGWGAIKVSNNKMELLDSGYFCPVKHENVVQKLIDARKSILEIIYKIKPNYIGIENIIKFMKGKSSADTVVALTEINRMVCLASYDYLNALPELFNVLSIRSGLNKLSSNVKKPMPKKEDMPDLVSTILGITFTYELNKRGTQKSENNDVADGIAVALYYASILSNKIKLKKKPIKKNLKKTKVKSK
jgi:Holliday junction resolvasome RuvABC endonuclease subunit